MRTLIRSCAGALAALLWIGTAFAQTPGDVRDAVTRYWQTAQKGFMDLPGLGNCPEYFSIENALIVDRKAAAQGGNVTLEVQLVLRPKIPDIGGQSAVTEVCTEGTYEAQRLNPAELYRTARIVMVLSQWNSGWRVEQYQTRFH